MVYWPKVAKGAPASAQDKHFQPRIPQCGKVNFPIGKLNILIIENGWKSAGENKCQINHFRTKRRKSDAREWAEQTFSEREFRDAKKWVFPLGNSTFWDSKIDENPQAKTKVKSMIFGSKAGKATPASGQNKRFLNVNSGMRKSEFSHWETRHA